MDSEIDKILEGAVGRNVDLCYVHHREGMHLRTEGKLIRVTDEIIELELPAWKGWFWFKYAKTTAKYILNRKASSILSIVIDPENW